MDLGFTFEQRQDGRVEVFHHGRLAATLRGNKAVDFFVEASSEDDAAQQLMARLTGNYKRGNERTAANHPRNRS